MNKLFKDLKEVSHMSENTLCGIGIAPDPATFMDSETNRIYLSTLNVSRPTDIVACDLTTAAKLIGLWKSGSYEELENTFEDIPSDLFFSGNIPLMDMMIECDLQLKDIILERFRARVLIYPGFHERIMDAVENEMIDVGIISLSISEKSDKEIFTVLAVMKGNEYTFRSKEKGYKGFSPNGINHIVTVSTEGMERRLNIILNIWYGIQLALLNPLTKDVFSHGRPVPMDHIKPNSNPKKDKKKKKVVKYIKRHVVNPEELDMSRNVSTDNGRTYVRRTMAWYVIGHWRTNKNGKKTFIKGYWKGPLKSLKDTETRERKIVTV